MFFDFTRHILWRNTIIGLAKLVTNKERTQQFNIFHLLNRMKKNGQYGNLTLKYNQIEKWEGMLKDKDETISEIKILRDKLYSHTDKNLDEYIINSKLDFQKIGDIITLLNNIIKDIYLEILDTQINIEPIETMGDNFKIIKILAEHEERRKQDIVNRFIEQFGKFK